MTRRFTSEQRRARLAQRHRLTPDRRIEDVARVADDVVVLHSSDPVTVYLSAMVRMARPSVPAVERALYDDRSVVRHHAMRRTLWVATPDVVRTMHAAATRKIALTERRRNVGLLGANGIEDPERWMDDARSRLLDLLHEHGPATTRELGAKVDELRHPIELAPGKSYGATVSSHTRILLQLGFEGYLVRTRPVGTWVSGQYTWAAMDSWLDGGLGEVTEREAARDLADRYLRAFGPATGTDLQWWAGWTAATTRRALQDAAAEPVDVDGGEAWVAADDAGRPDRPAPWVALLPSLDPTVMGWKQRDWYLPATAADAFDTNGNAGPTIWVDGRVVGAWAQTPDGELRTHYFEEIPPARRAEVQQRVSELASWIGDTRFTVRFPGRVNKSILAEAAHLADVAEGAGGDTATVSLRASSPKRSADA